MKAQVGVIVRTKDRPLFLRRAVASVCAQTFGDWNLVIVNDGGERRPVDELVHALPADLAARIQIVHSPVSAGRSEAGNLGFARLDTENIALLDDDDTWEPDFLSAGVEALDQARTDFPSVRGVTVASNTVTERVEPGGFVTIGVNAYNSFPDHPTVVSLDAMLLGSNLLTCGVLLSRETIAAAGGLFDPALDMHEDWDSFVRFMMQGDIVTIPDRLANYHVRPQDSNAVTANSVFSQKAEAETIRQWMMNEWLRGSFASHGFGEYANARQHFSFIQNVRNSTAERTGQEIAQLTEAMAVIIDGLAGVDDALARRRARA